MLDILFKSFNHYRKKKYLNNPLFKTGKQYACIGVGMHSLTCIYPVLRHFNIRVKYICTAHTDWSKEMSTLFPGSIISPDITNILNDVSIEGVFVCAAPDAHYQLIEALLKAGKKVFVEKPPCSSLAELQMLIGIDKAATCKVGLQRRYWPGNKHVLKQIGKARSYIYQYYFGPYPRGNVFTELFIHAIDYCIFLFGNAVVLSTTRQQDKNGITMQFHLQHSGGVAGMIELSSHHSWNDPVDNMSIQCADELLTVKYPLEVTGLQKPARILNLPAERLYQKAIITKSYFSIGNLLIPAAELNTLVLQGFYRELECFIRLVESGYGASQANDLPGLVPVYTLLDALSASR